MNILHAILAYQVVAVILKVLSIIKWSWFLVLLPIPTIIFLFALLLIIFSYGERKMQLKY